MMWKLLPVLPIAIALLISGCDNGTPSGAPSVTYEVKGTGDTLLLSWTELSGVDGYYVYADGEKNDMKKATSAYVLSPAKVIEVCGYNGDKDGTKWRKDFSPTITTTITVYADSIVGHKNAFGFNTSGDAITYFTGNTADRSNIDFSVEDLAAGISFVSPHQGGYNGTKWCGSYEELTGDFDYDQAAVPGSCVTPKLLINGAVYSLYLDRDNDNWDTDNDHFGKAKVLSISGTEVQLKVAYQTEAGLRWLKTP